MTEKKVIKYTTIAVKPETKQKLKILSVKHRIKLSVLLENMVDYFIEFNENPNSELSKKGLRQTIISFIKEQEKRYHKPNKSDIALMVHILTELKGDLKFLFDYLKTKK